MTTTVLSILLLITLPTRVFLVDFCSSMIPLPLCSGFAVHLGQNRENPRYVLFILRKLGGVVQLSGRLLKREIKLGLPDLVELLNQLIFSHFPQSARFHSISCLETKRVGTGSFCEARLSASRAVASFTPFISYRTRPGLTTAIQPSGAPLPLPIRVSAGFFVKGLSGNIRIQTLPPRFTWRVI